MPGVQRHNSNNSHNGSPNQRRASNESLVAGNRAFSLAGNDRATTLRRGGPLSKRLAKRLNRAVIVLSSAKRHWLVQWKYVVAFSLVYCALISMFSIAWNRKRSPFVKGMDVLADVVLVLDLFMIPIMNVIEAEKDQSPSYVDVITGQKKTNWQRYWDRFTDFYAALPIGIIAATGITEERVSYTFILLRVIKWPILKHHISLMKVADASAARLNPLLRLWKLKELQLLFKILVIFHFLACFWVLSLYASSGVNWMATIYPSTCLQAGPEIRAATVHRTSSMHHMDECNPFKMSDMDQYLYGIYWVSTTLMSVGYGDISPAYNVNLERLYAIGVQIIGSFALGFISSSMRRWLDSRNPQFVNVTTENELKQYIRDKGLTPQLATRIRKHFDYLLLKHKALPDKAILLNLSSALRGEAVLALLPGHLKTLATALPDFSGASTSEFLADLASFLKPFQMPPGSTIIHEGRIVEEIYFVTKGICEAFKEEADENGKAHMVVQGLFSDNSYFGDYPLFCKERSEITVRCKGYVDFMALPMEGVEYLNQRHPHEMTRFEDIANGNHQLMVEIADRPTVLGHNRRHKREVLHNWKPCSFETIFQEFYRERKALGPGSVSAATQEQQQQLHALQERQTMHEKWIIDPNSQFKTVWDAILSLMTVLSCVIVPFQTCFNLGYNALDILFNVLYSLDILVSLRTAFLDENATHLVMDPTVIAKRYLRQWFTIDFLSSGIVDVLVLLLDQPDNSARSPLRFILILRLLRLLKLTRVFRLSRALREVDAKLNLPPVVGRVLRLIGNVLFIMHICACFWYLIGVGADWKGEPSPSSWVYQLYEEDYNTTSLTSRYISSLYWASTTITTTGYGDIVPVTSVEIVFAIVTEIIGSLVFAYVVNSIGIFLSRQSYEEDHRSRKINLLDEFLQEFDLSKKFLESVKKQWNHVLRQRKTYQENSILEKLPLDLQREVLSHLYAPLIAKFPLFWERDPSFISNVLPLLVPLVVEQHELLVSQGSVATEIFFVFDGVIEIYQDTKVEQSPTAAASSRHSPSAKKGESEAQKEVETSPCEAKVNQQKDEDWTRKSQQQSQPTNERTSQTEVEIKSIENGHLQGQESANENKEGKETREKNTAYLEPLEAGTEAAIGVSQLENRSQYDRGQEVDLPKKDELGAPTDKNEEGNPSSKSATPESLPPQVHSPPTGPPSAKDSATSTIRLVKNVLGPGAFFGHEPLLNDEPHPYSIRAFTQCQLYVLKLESIQQLIARHPELATELQEAIKQSMLVDTVRMVKNELHFAQLRKLGRRKPLLEKLLPHKQKKSRVGFLKSLIGFGKTKVEPDGEGTEAEENDPQKKESEARDELIVQFKVAETFKHKRIKRSIHALYSPKPLEQHFDDWLLALQKTSEFAKLHLIEQGSASKGLIGPRTRLSTAQAFTEYSLNSNIEDKVKSVTRDVLKNKKYISVKVKQMPEGPPSTIEQQEMQHIVPKRNRSSFVQRQSTVRPPEGSSPISSPVRASVANRTSPQDRKTFDSGGQIAKQSVTATVERGTTMTTSGKTQITATGAVKKRVEAEEVERSVTDDLPSLASTDQA